MFKDLLLQILPRVHVFIHILVIQYYLYLLFYFLNQAADKQLRKLDIKYTQFIVYELDETRKQFKEKQILISVFGRQNTGKSTLLNSVLKARLALTLLMCQVEVCSLII